MTPWTLTNDFDCFAEEHDGRTWLHHTVRRWTPRVLRAVITELGRIQAVVGDDLWVLDNDPEVTPLLPKYLHLLGFQPAELIANNGRIRTAFVKRQPSHG